MGQEHIKVTALVRGYKEAKIEKVIRHMGLISEIRKCINSEHNFDFAIQNQSRISSLMEEMEMEIPLSIDDKERLHETRIFIDGMTNKLDVLSSKAYKPFSMFLDELMIRYRKILRERYQEL